MRWNTQGGMGVMSFGKPLLLAPDGTARSESAYGVRFLFTGREYLAPLGLYDYRHRAYSPTLGRFLQPDPIGFASGDVTLYRYSGNNPMNVTDPLGLCADGRRRIWGFVSWPDYWVLNINIAIPTPWTGTIIGWSGTLAVDRHRNVVWSPLGLGIGKSTTIVSLSLQAGWLNQATIPSESQTLSFLTSHGVNEGGGYIGGGSVQWSPGSGTATQLGIFTPQVGVSYNDSFLVRKQRNRPSTKP